MVLTPGGYVAIKSLKRGDTVLTADRRRVKVERLHKFTVPARKDTIPCIIPAGLYGCRRPLLISPDHMVQTGGAGEMARAVTLGLRRMLLRGNITYYNVELPDYYRDRLVVNGVKVESMFNPRRHRKTASKPTVPAPVHSPAPVTASSL